MSILVSRCFALKNQNRYWGVKIRETQHTHGVWHQQSRHVVYSNLKPSNDVPYGIDKFPDAVNITHRYQRRTDVHNSLIYSPIKLTDAHLETRATTHKTHGNVVR